MRNEREPFRITSWPDRLTPPSEFALPRLVGVVGPNDVPPSVAPGLDLLETLPVLRDERWPRGPIAGDELYTRFRLAPELAALIDDPRGADLLGWLYSAETDVRRFTHWSRPQPRIDYLLFDMGQTVPAPLPDEMFMREFLAVDSSDLLDVAVATINWGPLAAPVEERPRRWSDPEGFVASRPPSSASYLDRYVTHNISTGKYTVERQDGFDTHWDLIAQRYLHELGYTLWVPDGPQGEQVPAHGRTVLVLPIREYVERFRVLQALLESWALRQDAQVGDQTGDLSLPWVERNLPPPASNLDALDTLVRSFNAGLSGLGPHLSVEGTHSWWRPVPRLTAALFLQVHAFVSDGLPARRCANEPCRRWFTRQQGRAQHGQRRTAGVIYCSSSCAKAQTQREYRRRKRN